MRPLNFTVRSPMREYSFSQWMTVRARRLRIYRRILNGFWAMAALIVVVNLLRSKSPQAFESPFTWLIVSLQIAGTLFMLCWIPIAAGFLVRAFKCPSCDSPWVPFFGWVTCTCGNCRFNICTMNHGTSNNRSSGRDT